MFKKIFTASIAVMLFFASSVCGMETITLENDDSALPRCKELFYTGELTEISRPKISLFASSAATEDFDSYLREKILNHDTKIDISAYKIEVGDFTDRFFSFVFCNGDLPIRAGYSSGTYHTIHGTSYMSAFSPSYLYKTKAESDTQRAKFLNLVDRLTEYANNGKSDVEKALLLYDKIAADFNYSEDVNGEYPAINYTPYGFIYDGTAVCQGYASLYKQVLNRCGIESEVYCNENKSVNHVWNCIKLDNAWYHSDPTWAEAAIEYIVSHKYFLLNDEDMLADGEHGNTEDWKVLNPDITSIYCAGNDYKTGYIFNGYNYPIFKDGNTFHSPLVVKMNNGTEKTVTMRAHGIKTGKGVFSDYENGEMYLITTANHATASKLIVALYDGNGQFQKHYTAVLNTLSPNTLMKLPVGLEMKDTKKIKYMIMTPGAYTPICDYGEILY